MTVSSTAAFVAAPDVTLETKLEQGCRSTRFPSQLVSGDRGALTNSVESTAERSVSSACRSRQRRRSVSPGASPSARAVDGGASNPSLCLGAQAAWKTPYCWASRQRFLDPAVQLPQAHGAHSNRSSPASSSTRTHKCSAKDSAPAAAQGLQGRGWLGRHCHPFVELCAERFPLCLWKSNARGPRRKTLPAFRGAKAVLRTPQLLHQVDIPYCLQKNVLRAGARQGRRQAPVAWLVVAPEPQGRLGRPHSMSLKPTASMPFRTIMLHARHSYTGDHARGAPVRVGRLDADGRRQFRMSLRAAPQRRRDCSERAPAAEIKGRNAVGAPRARRELTHRRYRAASLPLMWQLTMPPPPPGSANS